MNLLETLLSANNGGVVSELAKTFGVGESDARNAVRQMAPAVTRGLRRNTQQSGGLEALVGALTKGNHGRYLDQPSALSQPGAVSDGNAILGHVFGTKDVSRNVAAHAASETGLDAGLLKKMLPLVAAAAMGAMGKQASGGGMLSQLAGGGRGQSQVGGMLASFLDADGDGSGGDDLLSMAKKFF